MALSQVDTEFWFVVPELSHRGNTGGTPGTLRIATLELPATVTISMPANPYNAISNPNGFQDIVVNIAANSTAAVDLSHLIDVAAFPARNFLENKPLTPAGINNFGLHITATNMITVYWEVNYDYGSDLWTLKGRNALGTLFYTPFQTAYNNRNITPVAYSAIDIGATEDNTQVTITLPPGKAASFGSTLSAIPPGGTYTLTLNRGQTFSLFPFQYSTLATNRLAGTRIESTNPICVILKDDAIQTSQNWGQDVVGDQIVPVNIIGNNYIVPEINNPNHVYVLATEDNTSIYVYDPSGLPVGTTPYTTLQRGQQALVVVPGGSKFVHITSSLNPSAPVKPFYTFQMGIEGVSRGGAIVPAIGCTGNTQLAFTRARSDNKFYFFIIVKKGSEDEFYLDGIRQTDTDIIKPGAFTEIGNTGFMAWFSNSINSNTLTVGQHLVENTGDIFHLGILNGFPSSGAQGGRLYYGYYSDFGGLNIGASVAGTNSVTVRACYGDPVQLYAYGGTNYRWIPDTYLDDATSNLPTAIDLPPGPHRYSVEISGACATGIRYLTVVVSDPVRAFFQTNVSSGCSPLEIQFEDQSEGAYSWQYDMGNGTPLVRYDYDDLTPFPEPPQPFSFTQTYTNTTNLADTVTVTLLVKNGSGCADIFTKTIVVFPEIHSAFSVDGASTGCDPLPVQFVNSSSGNTDTWFWEFGDGGSSIDENPQHTFRNLFGPGPLEFETRLIAISPYYCRDTSTYNITVFPYIEANFVFDTVFACTPHEIIITDQSFGADLYFWDFGDGSPVSTSPGPQISKTYINNLTVPDTLTIRLRVENNEGCFDIIERDVIVFPEIDASFTASPVEGCSPFAVEFFNNSSGAAAYFWDFGDGGTSSEEEPVHLYDRNMMDHDTTYTVTLIATSAEFCRDTMRLDILVHPYIEAAFAVNDIIGCDPFTITINNRSIGVDTYLWDFGDGTPVSTTSETVFEHIYRNPGSSAVVYPLRLIVLNEEGCSDTLIRNITVHPLITADFTATAFEGCHPLAVRFTNQSVNAVNYLWDFGDGGSTVQFSPEHTFNNFGTSDTTYMVTLTTSTADGVCVKSVSWPIIVHPQATAEFTFSKALGCNPFEVTFENISTGGSYYIWNFGDGRDTITTDLNPVTHVFRNSGFVNTARFNVSLTAVLPVVMADGSQAECSNQIIKPVEVYPDIVTAFSTNTNEGCHPLEVAFFDESHGVARYLWDFGDGAFSNIDNPRHTFTNTGTVDSIYTVTLIGIAANNACTDTFSVDITVHPYINADFTFDKYIDCSPFTLQFYNASVGGGVFHWDFGDGTDTTTTDLGPVVHVFNNPGFLDSVEYHVTLTATLTADNLTVCSSRITKTVAVYPAVEAAFAMSVNEGCHPLEVEFPNSSQGGLTYSWDFGDGSSSSADSPRHTFTNFTDDVIKREVKLIATSRFYCVSEITDTITIHPKPRSRFETDKIIDCPPFEVAIVNTSLNADHYAWNFGDGEILDTDSEAPINHIYNNLTDDIVTYTVRLISTSDYGCADSSRQNLYVYPGTTADFSTNKEGCSPLTSNFFNESILGDSYLWDFGDGSGTSVKDPTHVYFNFSAGDVSYYVTLTSTSKYGCIDSMTDTLYVYPQPRAEFTATPSHQTFPSSTVILSNMTNNPGTWSYLWDMGDDFTSNLENPLPHTYTDWGEYDIKLYVSSAHCYDSVSHKIRIFPGPPVAAFDTIYPGCEPHTVQFRNNSLHGDSYLWEFDDGTSSTEFEPVHTFVNYGIYNVKLTVTGEGGRDYAYRQVEVYRKPLVNFSVAPALVMLPDQEIQLYNLSEHGATYLWNFGDGNTSADLNPTHLYSTVGIYDISLDVWTEHGCTDRLVKPDAVTVRAAGSIKFPNAFFPEMSGPNGGYYNLWEPELDNVFHPIWEGVEKYRLEIYNRWGVLLYVSEDVMIGWDGYYQGKLSMQGVYVWQCTGTFVDGRPFKLVGDVTLLLRE